MGIFRNDWQHVIGDEFERDYFIRLGKFLVEEYRNEQVYPDESDIFSAMNVTSYSDTLVVILGQDPYHGPNQAHGLSFSVRTGCAIPPSLRNIYKELSLDCGCTIPSHGCLTKWAEQGVLLLNTVLTVRQGEPNSHRGKGWETFTDQVIERLSRRQTPIVFLLWGSHAAAKKSLIHSHHYILESSHPSPLSAHRGFLGSRPFSKTNAILRELGHTEIDWQL